MGHTTHRYGVIPHLDARQPMTMHPMTRETMTREPMTSNDDPAPSSHPGHAVGLQAGQRFKCEGCGNLTRFDVEVAERARRYWHVAVSGEGQVEHTEVLDQTIETVTCRWCGSSDKITTEPAPFAGVDQSP